MPDKAYSYEIKIKINTSFQIIFEHTHFQQILIDTTTDCRLFTTLINSR